MDMNDIKRADLERWARATLDHISQMYAFNPGNQEYAGAKSKFDANETVMLAQQLEYMMSRVFENVYEINRVREFFPVNTEVDPGASTFAYEETDHVGVAAPVVEDDAQDLPSVKVQGEKVVNQILTLGNSYSYSIQDMLGAAFSGKPLTARHARAARLTWERGLDNIVASGNSQSGIASGLINNSNVAIQAQAATGVFSSKTGDQILADLNLLIRSVFVDSKQNYRANSLLLPTAEYMYIEQTRMALAEGNAETILRAFQNANPSVTLVAPWDKLDGAGASGRDRLIAYQRSEDISEVIIARDFTVVPPQPRGLGFTVNCYGRTGGGVVYRPLGMKYQDIVV